MSKNEKHKLSFEDLYYKLAEKGITFNNISKDRVIEILQDRNYYYRIASYRKNFRKDSNNEYINLDFSTLEDLASIDVYLREYLLSLCIDIEHITKTLLMRDITYNSEEDGYKIVERFSNIYFERYQKINSNFSKSLYLKDMYNKRRDKPIWVFLEIMSLGDLSLLLELYVDIYNISYKPLKQLSDNLRYVKNIRNTCAHNNVFLINLYSRKDNKINTPSQYANSIRGLYNIDIINILYVKPHDLLVLFNLHKSLCSQELNNRRKREGQKVLDRVHKNYHKYKGQSEDLDNFFEYLNNLIDIL